MMFTKKEMILLATFGSEDAGQTRRNLTKAARLARRRFCPEKPFSFVLPYQP